MKRHRQHEDKGEEEGDETAAKAPRGSVTSDNNSKSNENALAVEMQCLTNAPPELLKQVRKLNLGVLPVQCPDFCYKRAARDAEQLSWAAVLTGSPTEERASNKSSDTISTVAGAIIAEYEPLNRAVHVRTLAVEPRHRRLGIGRQLVDKVVRQTLALRQAADGADNDTETVRVESVRLHVHVGNAGGIAFYTRAGFKEQARLENYYRHLEPRACLVLSYALPANASDRVSYRDGTLA